MGALELGRALGLVFLAHEGPVRCAADLKADAAAKRRPEPVRPPRQQLSHAAASPPQRPPYFLASGRENALVSRRMTHALRSAPATTVLRQASSTGCRPDHGVRIRRLCWGGCSKWPVGSQYDNGRRPPSPNDIKNPPTTRFPASGNLSTADESGMAHHVLSPSIVAGDVYGARAAQSRARSTILERTRPHGETSVGITATGRAADGR
jgi:hypothetical protein